MRFTAIDTSAWEELKKSIEELALCMREHFGTKPELPDLLQRGCMPNTEHQQANAPTLSGHFRAALKPNWGKIINRINSHASNE